MNEMEIRNTFFQWLFKQPDIPIDIFDNIEIKTAKIINIPRCYVEVEAVYSWVLKWQRTEDYLSHINNDGKAVYEKQTYTTGRQSTSLESGGYNKYFSLIKDRELSLWFEGSGDRVTSEKFFSQIQNERNFMSFDEKLSEVQKNLTDEFFSILQIVREREQQYIDNNYRWYNGTGSTINFEKLKITDAKKILNEYYFIEYIYNQKTYYWFKQPSSTYCRYSGTPKVQYENEIENKLLRNTIWWGVVPFGITYLMAEVFQVFLGGGLMSIRDFIAFSISGYMLFFLGIAYFGVFIYRSMKTDANTKKAKDGLQEYIRRNRHDLCPIFDLIPNVDSDTDDNRKRKKDLVDLRESYISRKEEFIKKYEPLGYKEFNSEVGLYFAMKKDTHVVTIYIDEEKMKIVEQEGEQQS